MTIDTTRNEVNRALAAENMCSHLLLDVTMRVRLQK